MTPSEFKAWFDGFTEAFNGSPTKAQWARIKARVGEIDGKPVTHAVYLDRYLPSYPYWYQHFGITSSNTAKFDQALSQMQNTKDFQAYANANQVGALTYNSHTAMSDLGRAEAKSLAA